MYIHPLVAVLALAVAALAGAVISFIWTSSGLGKSGKIEHSVLALAYAASLLIFILGTFKGAELPWAWPTAVMIMGSGTAWANYRAGTEFWLVFGLMTVLGGISTLAMQTIPNPSLGLFLALNIPWLALMVWLIFMIIYRSCREVAAHRK